MVLENESLFIIQTTTNSYVQNGRYDTADLKKAKKFTSYKQAKNYATHNCPFGSIIVPIEEIEGAYYVKKIG